MNGTEQADRATQSDETAQISRTDQEKVRSLLRSMEEQVSRRIRVRTEHEDFRLTYGSSILQNRTIRRMMEYVGTLDAEEYPRFVRELSESVFLQWQERQGSRITVKNENRTYSEKELQLVHIDTLTDSLYAGRAEADRRERIPDRTDTSTASSQQGRRYPGKGENISEYIPRSGSGIWSGENKDGLRRTEESETAGSRDVAEDIRENEFREWGRALLVYAGYRNAREDDIASGGVREGRHTIAESGKYVSAELILGEKRNSADQDEKTPAGSQEIQKIHAGQVLQTADIRRQIELGKMRSQLRSMEEQISRQISVQTGRDDFYLSYENGILQDRTIRRLVERIGNLDAEEYPQFVRRLSESVYRQWREQHKDRHQSLMQNSAQTGSQTLNQGSVQTGSQTPNQGPAQTESRIQYQGYVQRQRTGNLDGETRTNLVYTAIPEGRVRTEREYISVRDRVLSYERERRARTGEWAYRFRAAYAADGFRQTEGYEAGSLYEGDSGRAVRQMTGTVSGGNRNPAANPAYSGITGAAGDTEALLTLNQSDTAGASSYGEREESPRIYTDNTAMQSILTQTRIRVQEETRERKTVQEQINNRLNELEQQLSRKIKQTGATESAADLAEQVKRQLHEELHMEKLRRGLS